MIFTKEINKISSFDRYTKDLDSNDRKFNFFINKRNLYKNELILRNTSFVHRKKKIFRCERQFSFEACLVIFCGIVSLIGHWLLHFSKRKQERN